MKTDPVGIPTHHTRVERWECDHNNHWNTRFYGRSFQQAAECIAAETVRTRHVRFHRELFVQANVEVRSAWMEGDTGGGDAVVHLLTGNGELAATALDFPASGQHLPRVSGSQVLLALPRGIGDMPIAEWTPFDASGSSVQLGTVQASQIDHRGELLFEELIRHSAIASSLQLDQLGFTPEFLQAQRVGCMAVEARVTRCASPAVGSRLSARSRLSAVGDKSFQLDHQILTHDGQLVASLEFCQLCVALDTRRATKVPTLIHEAWRQRNRP